MRQEILHVALLVRDYDEAIEFYCGKLRFTLVEDTVQPEQDKRWVVVAPPGSSGTALLLARAATPEQAALVGRQGAGRVFLFLRTDDFWRDHRALLDAGVRFVREPKQESYGVVAVFEDLYGNRWDLLQPSRVTDERAAELVRTLELRPHPEGGYYRETWRSDHEVAHADGRGARSALTSIWFLLPAEGVSRWHRVRSDEVWHHVEGAPLELWLASRDGRSVERVMLGPLAGGGTPVYTVPAHRWQAARAIGGYALAGCTVGPGFSFDDFELLADRSAEADALCAAHPEARRFR